MSVRKPIPLPADAMQRIERAYAELCVDLEWAHIKAAAFMTVALGCAYMLYLLAKQNHPQIILMPPRRGPVPPPSDRAKS